MAENQDFSINDQWILSLRGDKNPVDPARPWAHLIEKERAASGDIQDVLTVFLTNRECPFRCLMCDLWKNTTEKRVDSGIIPDQIRNVLDIYPQTRQIKLYNSGNFFDIQAIPQEDYKDIASLLNGFENVIVESHPKLINKRSLIFRDLLTGKLEVAIGLETANPDILSRLNKRMTLEDFIASVKFLNGHDIPSRAFILLGLPFLNEKESVIWAKRSIDFAFNAGVSCCVVIPTHTGNGALDELQKSGYFQIPSIKSLEEVLEYGINLNAGRVFADLWDLKLFSTCDKCLDSRYKRLNEMNLQQVIQPTISCSCDTPP